MELLRVNLEEQRFFDLRYGDWELRLMEEDIEEAAKVFRVSTERMQELWDMPSGSFYLGDLHGVFFPHVIYPPGVRGIREVCSEHQLPVYTYDKLKSFVSAYGRWLRG